MNMGVRIKPKDEKNVQDLLKICVNKKNENKNLPVGVHVLQGWGGGWEKAAATANNGSTSVGCCYPSKTTCHYYIVPIIPSTELLL